MCRLSAVVSARGVSEYFYFVDGAAKVVDEGDGAVDRLVVVGDADERGGGVGADGEGPEGLLAGLADGYGVGVGHGGACRLLPEGKRQPEVVDACAVVVLASRGIFPIDPFQTVLAGGEEAGVSLPPCVAAPIAASITIDIEVEPVGVFAGEVVEEGDGVVDDGVDVEDQRRLQGVVDGRRAGAIGSIMGREGVDEPVIKGGVLPREVGEVGSLERLGGAVTGEPIGVGVVPIAVLRCERQL